MPELQHPIRQARLAKGLTQADLARRVGVDHTTISGFENSRYRPDPDTAIEIADVLGMTLDQIYRRASRAA